MILENLDPSYCEKVIYGWLQLATSRVRSEGVYWYSIAHTIAEGLAIDYSVPLDRVCAVIATLSPGCNWEQNVVDSETVIRAFVSGLEPEDIQVSTYNPQKQKAFLILRLPPSAPRSEILRLIGLESARKTRAFFDNILDPDHSQDVTIDRWIARAVLLQQNATHPTEKTYALIRSAFQRVAVGLELRPCQVQAIVWLVIRDRGLDHAAQQYLF